MDEEFDGNEVLEKEENWSEKVEPVSRALKDMGSLWKAITTKMGDDAICYMCKRELTDKEEFDVVEVPSHKVDKGLIAFVCICKDCNKD